MTLRELQEKRGRLVTQAREALEEIRSNTDESRAAELEERHDTIMAEFDTLERSIEREEKFAAVQRRMEEAEERQRRNERPGAGEGQEARGDEDQPVTYRQAFHRYLAAKGELGIMDPEARSVLQRGFAKLEGIEQRAQTTADAAGGYSVPEEMMEELVRTMKAFGPMYDENVCRVITTSGGNTMPFPTIDDTGKTGGAHTEGATMTDDGGQDAVFGQRQLDAYEFDTEWLRVSKALSDDSFLAMESLLNDLLGERLGRLANAQLTTGSGTSAPNGIVTATSAGKTAASTSAITYDEILDFIHSVDPAYRSAPSVGFMFNDDLLLTLRKLTDGNGNYLWQAGNIQAGVPSTLDGRRYFINQDMASIATSAKVMLFGDFKKYYVRKVGAPLIGAIQDKDFWPGFGVAGYIRFDGELADTAAVKHFAMAAV